jgi:hypothetical protein
VNNFHDYHIIAVNYKHAEMIRQAQHALLVRQVREYNRKGQPNRFAQAMRGITHAFATMAQRLHIRNARHVSGHAR